MPPDVGNSRRRASYVALLREPTFFRFILSQGFSAFGDWMGMIAILYLVQEITNNEFAVAAALLARLAPALFFGPVAGVIVDRWNRKRVMVLCDLGRGVLLALLPFVESIPSSLPWLPAVVLFAVSAALEILTLLWQPAKDAALPHMVSRPQLLHANTLMLTAAYGTFPLSGVAFSLLAAVSIGLGSTPQHVALVFDGFTFAVSAAITATLAIPHRARPRRDLNVRQVWRDFVNGISFIREHPMIRPWILGIGTIFFGLGGFMSIAVIYVRRVLEGGAASFGLLVTAVGIGLGLGFALSAIVARVVPRDVLFSATVFGLGAAVIGFGSVETLSAGSFMGVACGLFAGVAYPAGLTLVQENVADELRGRTLASMYSVVRLALVGSLAAAPVLARLINEALEPWDHRITVLDQQLALEGERVTLWLGGMLILVAAGLTARAVGARRRTRERGCGLFLVFEGGEGTGKSTQIHRLATFLEARGAGVLVTREPGGSAIGERIRSVLLDPRHRDMSSKAEALLYAADRAQHVEEVIRPALDSGMVVLSDRYLDSSLAYQGLARGLGVQRVLDLNEWAVGALLPDVVFLLDLRPEQGLERIQTPDRIEQEGSAFHIRVREAYRTLSERYPWRFVVIDAARSPEAIEAEIRHRVLGLLEQSRAPAAETSDTAVPTA
ncbi:MAG: dTMP kinase [Actinomycetota bacterium]